MSAVPLPWHTPLELSHQYDSMRGSLKRKASLGLVDMRNTSRRRSSGESGGSRRGSRSGGADKLPPMSSQSIAAVACHEASMGDLSGRIRREEENVLQGIVPKIEEEEALFAEDGVDSADPPPFYPAAAALVVSAGREEESEGNKARHEEEEGQSVRSRGSKVVSNARIEGLLEHRSSPQANRDKGEIDRQVISTAAECHTRSSSDRCSVSHPVTPRHRCNTGRALSAVLEAAIESDISGSSSGGSIGIGIRVSVREGGEAEAINQELEEKTRIGRRRRAQSLPLPENSTKTSQLSPVTMSTAGRGGDGSQGSSSGGTGGGRRGGSPYKRASRSVGPAWSASSARRRGSLSAAAASTTAAQQSQQYQTLSTLGSNAAPSPSISFLGLPSPTTPIEAASLQRSVELREEQRRIIDERRRMAAVAAAATSSTAVVSPSMSSSDTAITAQPTSARSTTTSEEETPRHDDNDDAPMTGGSSAAIPSTSRIPIPSATSMAKSPRLVEAIERLCTSWFGRVLQPATPTACYRRQ
ncbi:hypothetical protein P389DRAFT_167023 [Cystobasidium minutum MCA 4210]|uniref:uncharacterized protein n=1 Tax=Cystobasidium minutum MCA 4210 TaxID=1397322 RepID=UPI0034CE78F5|eukprot:jgi/Rhomi1/167023/fgenesh1_kg.2_\